jgi:hypothetical protein
MPIAREEARHAAPIRSAAAPTVTMGIDLAAQARDTGVCLLAWAHAAPPELLMLGRGESAEGAAFDDEWLADTATGRRPEHPGEVTKVGIDDPFGWPVPFIDALASHRDGPVWPASEEGSTAAFRHRETDRATQARNPSGRWPLSVSSDRIAVPAMRCAAILAEVARRRGRPAVAREGSGLCCEVYPDPALRIWTEGSDASLGKASYKRAENSGARVALLAAIRTKLPIADPRGRLAMVEREDDYLDALLCALVARAVEVGLTHAPTPAQEELARIEGWIHLPSAALGELARPLRR